MRRSLTLFLVLLFIVAGLAVLNSCGGGGGGDDAACVDDPDPGEICAAPMDIGTIAEGASTTLSYTIYPSGDEDYFRFYAEEGDEVCMPGSSQSYSVDIFLTPPQGDDCRDYDLYVYDDNCDLIDSFTQSGCVEEGDTLTWEGTCGFDDSFYFRVRVVGKDGASGCAGYNLELSMY